MKRRVREPELLEPYRVTVNKPVSAVVIGDSHSEPKYETDSFGQRVLVPFEKSNKRYEEAGQFVAKLKPDFVIDMGDFCDMSSFSNHSKVFNADQANMDYEAGKDARKRLTNEVRKMKGKKPSLIALAGNHDYQRISRFEEDNPQFRGHFSKDPSDAEGQGWIYLPYRKPLILNGVVFCHNLPSGVMNAPIGGHNMAMKIIKELGVSAVVGHSHIYDFKTLPNQVVKNRMALSVPCFFEDFHEWAGPANHMYSRGLTVLYNIEDGGFEHRVFSFKSIREVIRG